MRTLSLSKPHLIVMVGIPGSGKSLFADQFATTFSAPIVSFDLLRQEIFKKPTYSSSEQSTVASIADYLLRELFKTHQSIVFDGSADQRVEREALTRIAKAAGYETLFIWVQTEPASAEFRATKRKDKQRFTVAQFKQAVKLFNAPFPNEKFVVISGKHTFPSQLKYVLKKLVAPRTETAKLAMPQSRPIPPTPTSSSNQTNGRNIVIR